MSKTEMQRRYGVKIVWDYWLDEYRVYSADGCLWDKGFKNMKQVYKMLVADRALLQDIKAKVEAI